MHGQPVEYWDVLLIELITTKLDYNTNREWESTKIAGDFPTYKELSEFLAKKCKTLESLSYGQLKQCTVQINSNPNKTSNQNRSYKQTNHAIISNPNCKYCKQFHSINTCTELLKLPIQARIDEIKKLQLCLNCLGSNHTVSRCNSKYRCRICKKSHHSILHLQSEPPRISTELTPPVSEPQLPIATTSNHCNNNNITSQILLSTAVICVQDRNGDFQKLRCLLDQGSQSNLITKSACDRLQIKTRPTNIPISGINKITTIISQMVDITIKSQYNAFTANLACLILPEITSNLPAITFNKNALVTPPNLRMADPDFNINKPVDVLLGAEIFWQLLCIGQINNGINQPILHKTHLGWIVAGRLQTVQPSAKIICNLAINNLDSQLKKFWEINEPEMQSPPYTNSELTCEKLFKENYSRDASGRYTVALPFKENAQILGDSRPQALQRFLSLERKFQSNPNLKLLYSDFMKQYLDLGHMKLVECDAIESRNSFYLPHHAVLKDSSSTTKLRVVFDGSAKTSTGISLNETLLIGPTIQQDLFSILIRFRTHKYALTADVAKMYRQILVSKEDRRFQRILWRENPTDSLKTYELQTVTYGTAPASFLAIRTLFQLAYDEQSEFPLAHKIILTDFYVDDLLTGSNDLNVALQIKTELNAALSNGGFDLRKWNSNHLSLRSITNGNDAQSTVNLDKQDDTKVLGLWWNCEHDIFKYTYNNNSTNKTNVVTKRVVLSTIARLFDPLGLISPILMSAKILLQRLWLLNINWDESVPIDIHTTFLEILRQLPLLNQLKIDRQIISDYSNNSRGYELHGFSDASQYGYGACIYLRSSNPNNTFSMNLICAKGRVAPTKVISIPRLELCGALLLANLANKVKQALHLPFKGHYFWTDSMIVLAWLAAESTNLKTFVANRVSKIQSLSDASDWYHISTIDNPADIISRGSSPVSLLQSQLWFHGPAFFLTDPAPWKQSNTYEIDGEIPECKITVATVAIPRSLDVFHKFSSFYKLQTFIGYCLRLINKYGKNKQPIETTLCLSATERRNATYAIIRHIQESEFPNEISDLSKNNQVHCKSKLVSLNPFLGNDGLIRVGGRLKNAALSHSAKYPIALPANNHVTKLIIKLEHEVLLHAGQQTTLASLRQRYWPTSGKSTVRKVIHQCMKCFRAKPNRITQLMGDLPATRVNPSRPFYNCGVDFAGPIYLKQSRGRKSAPIKGYIVVFICFATRAIHLELASDLSTQCFLNSLRRFIARRGNIANIYSDNATNFVGANKELKDLQKIFNDRVPNTELLNQSAKLDITWHYIPARSPHFGGIWEGAVKSVKHHLRRIVSEASLNYEEMYTLLTRIEAILNSRPLYPLTGDPNDLQPLTPAHFLIGEPLTAPTEADVSNTKINRLARWERIEQLRQHFWKRWSQEYLTQLQQRNKWKSNKRITLEIGMLAVICEDNQPPMRWQLGRITQLHPGADGIIRVVSLKTSNGNVLRRAVARISVLPNQSSASET